MSRLGERSSPADAKAGWEPRDTAAGCRTFAAAEFALMESTADGFLRRRLERSAAAWTARAERLAIDETAYAQWRAED